MTPWLLEIYAVPGIRHWVDREARDKVRKAVLQARRERLEKDAPVCYCGTKMRQFKECTGFYCQHCLDYMDDLVTIVDGKPQRTGRWL